MKTIKRITSDTMHVFVTKVDEAVKKVIPMLPFVKMPFHDFNNYYHTYNEKGIFLIDELSETDYCLYHLYHLSEGDDTLRASLILPSNWEKRFDIIEESIPNLKNWFLTEDRSDKLIIQSLEYGEIEYYPTLSHYLIPTIIRNGFNPKYRMYMKREGGNLHPTTVQLEDQLCVKSLSDGILQEIIDFYYNQPATQQYRYFTNCTYDEFIELSKQAFTIKHSKFISDANGRVICGILVTLDDDKIMIDNFTVSPDYYDSTNLGEYLLNKTIQELSADYPEETYYIYLNRDCFDAVMSCEKNGFIPFEFWTDMILDRI